MGWMDEVYGSADNASENDNKLKRKVTRDKTMLRCSNCSGVFVVHINKKDKYTLCEECYESERCDNPESSSGSESDERDGSDT